MSAKPIGIHFVGTGSAMAATESAGVVAQTKWNQASGASSSSALALKDNTGASTGATLSWTADGVYVLPITDTAGNYRMMSGYLDNSSANPSTASVSNLPSNPAGWTVYVYCDGDNGTIVRTGTYQISGSGITTASTVVTDAGEHRFCGNLYAGRELGRQLLQVHHHARAASPLPRRPVQSSDPYLPSALKLDPDHPPERELVHAITHRKYVGD